MPLFRELQRRNVFRVAAAYVVGAWLLIEVGNTLEETLNLPDWSDTLLAFFLILGFPLALFFSWAYEITPEGVKREKDLQADQAYHAAAASKLNKAIVGLMAVALVYFAADKFIFSQSAEPVQPPSVEATAEAETAPAPEAEPVAAEAAGVPLKSIAVLPFVNMSSDPEQEYFSDGLTEELLNLLAGIDELKVAARTSSFFYKDKLDEIPMKEVARQLEVAHVLEGSVRKGGDKIRITAQLIKADDGFHLWSETYDRTMDDVFAIQDEIAAAVVEQLKITLLGEAPHQRVVDPESYQLSLRGRFLFNRRVGGDLQRALELFEEAVRIDPDNGIAWVGLAPLYEWLFDPPRLEDSRMALDRALELDPDNPEAMARKARYVYQSGQTEEATRLWERALEMGQDNALILSMRAGQSFSRGEIDEGLEWQRRALAADPLHLVNVGNTASYLLMLGRWREAEPYVDKVIELAPDNPWGQEQRALIALQQGQPEECLAILARLPPRLPDHVLTAYDDTRGSLAVMAQHALGNRVEADRLLGDYIESEQQRALGEMALNTALIYAYMGEADRAFEWIERALETSPNPPLQFFLEWRFARLFDDPRWQRVRALYPDFQGWDEVLR